MKVKMTEKQLRMLLLKKRLLPNGKSLELSPEVIKMLAKENLDMAPTGGTQTNTSQPQQPQPIQNGPTNGSV
jgi:hypothetical protein